MNYNLLKKQALTIISQTQPKVKHISFLIFKSNKSPICYGINKPFKTDPLAHKYGYRFNCIHSELAALKAFPYKWNMLSYFDMVNFRILANNKISMAKPCQICQMLLREFEIRRVYYSNYSGQIERLW